MNFPEYPKYEEWKNPLNPNVKAIDEWIEHGGFITYDYIDKNWTQVGLFRCDDDMYFNWLDEQHLVDTEENEKRFCRNALEQANVPSEVIEELMEW